MRRLCPSHFGASCGTQDQQKGCGPASVQNHGEDEESSPRLAGYTVFESAAGEEVCTLRTPPQ